MSTFSASEATVASEFGSSEIAQSFVALLSLVSENITLSSVAGVQFGIQVGKITSAICKYG